MMLRQIHFDYGALHETTSKTQTLRKSSLTESMMAMSAITAMTVMLAVIGDSDDGADGDYLND